MLRSVMRCIHRAQWNYSRKMNYAAVQRCQVRVINPVSVVSLFGRSYSTETSESNAAEPEGDEINFAELNMDPEQEELIKSRTVEMITLRENGANVCDPFALRRGDWEEILAVNSKSGLRKVYAYLFKKQMRKLKAQTSKEAKRLVAEERKTVKSTAAEVNNHIVYGLGQTALLPRIYSSTINKWRNMRLLQAKQYSSKIIFDCSYDAHMKRAEAKNTAEQITDCFAINRRHANPFDMHICGADSSGHTMTCLQKYIPTLMKPTFPMEVHAGNVIDVFPPERLVYLTPHCENDLEQFDHDDIYIIGGLVDKHHCFPVSLEKATAHGLRMAKLPLERYFHFKGDKTLTLDQVLRIMLDLKSTGSWQEAFKHLPKRKIAEKRNANTEESNEASAKNESNDG